MPDLPVKAVENVPLPSPAATGLVSFALRVRADHLVEWLDLQRRVSGESVQPVHAVARAVAMVLTAHPAANVRVDGGVLRKKSKVNLLIRMPSSPAGKVAAPLRQVKVSDAAAQHVLLLTKALEAPDTRPGFLTRAAQILLGTPKGTETAVVAALGSPGIAAGPIALPEGCAVGLSVGALEERAIAEQGQLKVRWVLPLEAVFDQRGVDPGVGLHLCREILDLLENPRNLETNDQHTGNVVVPDTSTEVELPDPTSA